MPAQKVPLWKPNHNFYGFDPANLPIDEIDQQILGLLLENGRASNTEIAKVLDVNESTVRRRIDSLIQRDIIKGFTVCLHNPKVQSRVRAYVYIKVDTPALDELVDDLCNSEHTLSVYRIVGQYDIICEVVFDGMSELHRFYDGLFKRSAVHDIIAYIVVNCYKDLPIASL